MIGQIYKITNIKNFKSYVGLTYNKKYGNEAYLYRYEKHMTCKGSLYISNEIKSGQYTRDDYIIELLETNINDVEHLRSLEKEYIKKFNTLYPNGLNGNIGNFIIITDEIKLKIKKTKEERKHLYKKAKHDGKAIYKHKNSGKIKRMNKNDKDVISGQYIHINYKNDCKERLLKNKLNEQRAKNNGITNKQKELWNKLKKLDLTKTDGWKEGRKKYKDRMAKKDYTEKQIEYWSKISDIVKADWDKRDKEYRNKKVKAGLDAMNSVKHKCNICGMETTKGNITRWHNDKCKKNKEK